MSTWWPGVDFIEDELSRLKYITHLRLKQEKQAEEKTRTLHFLQKQCVVQGICTQQRRADDVGVWQQEAPGKGSQWAR